MIERFLHNRQLIIHYYIVAIVVGVFGWWWMSREESIDGVIVAILALYLLIFPIAILYTRKYALHIFLFLLALITGFYSFYHYSVGEHSVLNALYFTFQLYLIDIQNVFTTDGSVLLKYPIVVEIARWSAAAYTISTVFIAMYRLLEMSILLVFYQIIGNHYVVFGYNENSVTLMKDLRKHKKRVILVADDVPNEAIDALEDLKIVVVRATNNEENIYTKCGLERAEKVVLFHEKDIDNLNALMKIDYFIENKSITNIDVSLFIHLKKTASRRLLTELEQGRERSFHVQRINVYDQFVDHLFDMYPLVQEESEHPLHVLIVGFGSMGQHIALKAIEAGQKIKHEKMLVSALDKRMDTIQPEWEQQHANAREHVSMQLQSFDVETEQIESMIKGQDIPVTHIYICLHEDYLDVLAGIELSNAFPTTPIFIEFAKNSIAEKWIESEGSHARHIYSTGTFEDVLKEDVLLKSTQKDD